MYGVTTFTYKFIREMAAEINAADGTRPDQESRAWAAEQAMKDINKHDDKIEATLRSLKDGVASVEGALNSGHQITNWVGSQSAYDLNAAIELRNQAWQWLSLILNADQLKRVHDEAARNRSAK